jgi:hypothetical protein
MNYSKSYTAWPLVGGSCFRWRLWCRTQLVPNRNAKHKCGNMGCWLRGFAGGGAGSQSSSTPADLVENKNLMIAGLRMWESRQRFPTLVLFQVSICRPTDASARKQRGPGRFDSWSARPRPPCQFVCQCNDGDVLTRSRRQLRSQALKGRTAYGVAERTVFQ